MSIELKGPAAPAAAAAAAAAAGAVLPPMTLSAAHPHTGLSFDSFDQLLKANMPLVESPLKMRALIQAQQRAEEALGCKPRPLLGQLLATTSSTATTAPLVPHLLVSHDFKGNYRPSDFGSLAPYEESDGRKQQQKDAALDEDGVRVKDTPPLPCDPTECFTMEQAWGAPVDVFNYFSHRRISVPPPEWVAAARNASNAAGRPRVIGTVITEWQEGKKECDWLLDEANPRRMLQIVMRLVALAAANGFDGYLVNIENPLTGSGHVQRMQRFVQNLSDSLGGVLGRDRALVLWYDSVTHDGALRWQNTLNGANCNFYAAAGGGIFCNYQWSEEAAVDAMEQVERMNADAEKKRAALPAAATAAGATSASSPSSAKKYVVPSVWMGTDCFGRNTFLGGEHASHKGVSAAMSLGLSAALFAPGWTMENFAHAAEGAKQIRAKLGGDGSDVAAAMVPTQWQCVRHSYLLTSKRFWTAVVAAAQEATARPAAPCWPVTERAGFHTTFCGGAGTVFAAFGSSGSSILSEWCQLSSIDPQPLSLPAEPCATRDDVLSASAAASSAPPVRLIECLTMEAAVAAGCLVWGNRALQVCVSRRGAAGGVLIAYISCSAPAAAGQEQEQQEQRPRRVRLVVEFVVPASQSRALMLDRRVSLFVAASRGNRGRCTRIEYPAETPAGSGYEVLSAEISVEPGAPCELFLQFERGEGYRAQPGEEADGAPDAPVHLHIGLLRVVPEGRHHAKALISLRNEDGECDGNDNEVKPGSASKKLRTVAAWLSVLPYISTVTQIALQPALDPDAIAMLEQEAVQSVAVVLMHGDAAGDDVGDDDGAVAAAKAETLPETVLRAVQLPVRVLGNVWAAGARCCVQVPAALVAPVATGQLQYGLVFKKRCGQFEVMRLQK